MNSIKLFINNKINNPIGKQSMILGILVLGSYLFFGKYIFVSNELIGIWVMVPLLIVLLLLFISFFVFDRSLLEKRSNLLILSLLLLLFIVQLIVIFVNPAHQELMVHSVSGYLIYFPIDITLKYRFQSAISFLSLLIISFTLLVLVPHEISPNSIAVKVLALGVVLFVIAAAIYSICTEFDKYISFFDNYDKPNSALFPKSFFPHKNNWGLLLFAGMISSWLLCLIFSKKWFLIIIPFFFVLMVFSLCKTTIVLSLVILVAVTIYAIIRYWNKRRVFSYSLIAVIFVLFIALFLLLLFSPLKNYMLSFFDNTTNVSTSSRLAIWKKVIELTSTPLKILFGNGFGVLSLSLLEANNRDPDCTQNWHVFKAHNMYLQSFGDGGLVLFLGFVLAIIFMARRIIKYRHTDINFTFFFAISFVSLLAVWFFES